MKRWIYLITVLTLEIVGFVGILGFPQTSLAVEPRSFPPPADTLPLIGHLGGSVRDIETNGSFVYALVGPDLAVIDFSDPEAPKRIGYVTLPLYPLDVDIVNHYAFVAATMGLEVIDVTDPAQPQLVASTEITGYSSGLTVDGTYVYVVHSSETPESYDSGGIRIFDVQNPLSPALITTVAITDFRPDRIDAHGGKLYVAGARVEGDLDSSGWFRIFDLSQPTQPVALGTYYNRYGSIGRFAVQKEVAYLQISYAPLHIVDVSEPATPTLITTYANLPGIGSIAISGTVMYAGSGDASSGISVVDISDFRNPQEIGKFDGGFCGQIYIVGNRLYYNCWPDGLRMADRSNPWQPQPLATYRPLGSGFRMDAVDEYVVTTGGGWPGLTIIDVSSPLMAEIITAYLPSAIYHAQDLTIQNRQLYLLGSTDDYRRGVEIVDLSAPSEPKSLGTYRYEGEYLHSLAVENQTLYVTYSETRGSSEDSYKGLRIVDVSDPRNPQEKGVLPLPGNGKIGGLAVAQQIAYFVDTRYIQEPAGTKQLHTIQIADVSDPSDPRSLATYPTRGEPWFLYINGSVLYISYEDHTTRNCQVGIESVDVSNPAAPRRLGIICWQIGIPRLAVHGDYLYAATGNSGLRVFDATFPWAIGEAGSDLRVGGASDLVIIDDTVHVIDWSQGLFSFGINPPTVTRPVSNSIDFTMTGDSVTYHFPRATFSHPVTLTHRTLYLSSAAFSGRQVEMGRAFQITATDSSGHLPDPTSPYSMVVSYRKEDLPLIIESSLALFRWNGRAWEKEASSQIDTSAKTVSAMPSALGIWALIGETNRRYLPFVSR